MTGHLIGAVAVEVGQPVIFDVAVGLVFSAVHHDEKYGPLAECVIRFAGRGGEVVEVMIREQAARFVVAACEQERDFGGEQFGRTAQKAVDQLLFAAHVVDHVAVEKDEVALLFFDVRQQRRQHVAVFMDVVDHGERYALLRGVPRFEAVRFFAVDVRADRLSVADFVRLQFGHFARAYSVAVKRGGLQSGDPHRMQSSHRPFAELGLVILRAFFGVEVVFAVGCGFDPRQRVGGGSPDYGGSVGRHVL